MNLSGHAEAVNNPGRVREMLKQLDPKLVALKRPCLLFFLKVYQPFTPGTLVKPPHSAEMIGE